MFCIRMLFANIIFASVSLKGGARKFGIPAGHNAALCDVAPTVLDLMGLDKPEDMGGISILQK